MGNRLDRIPVTLQKRDADDYLRLLYSRRRAVETAVGKAYRKGRRKFGRDTMLAMMDKRLARVLAAVDEAIDAATYVDAALAEETQDGE